ncbi:MAG: phosphoribosylglycinamide formyltransferase [Propionibacteriaceae bacterium]|nr:phosphoribosylglycinamide formyltransferase [Propionibacteriaceae bacterium]
MAKRVVVLISGVGTLLQALIDAQDAGELDAEIVGVVSDRMDAAGLARADDAGIESVVVLFQQGCDRAAWDAQLTAAVADFAPDLVVSAGFMRLLGPAFLAAFGGRAINCHPALLPAFPGMHAVRDALAAGVDVTGATVFEIDAGVDSGKIIAQEQVRVLPGDSEESLHERIKVTERALLVRVVNEWTKGMQK